MPLNAESLELLLEEFGVETEHWGEEEAKTVDALLREIREGESSLKIDCSGISRVVDLVKMFIRNAQAPENGFLIEWGQYLPDGRYRERRQHPAGKVKKGEYPEEALLREAQEELGLGRGDLMELSALSVETESRPSRSYPSLPCLYAIHGFTMVVGADSEICRLPEFSRTETDGGKLLFRWVP